MHPVDGEVDCTAFDFRSDILQEAVAVFRSERSPDQPFEWTRALTEQNAFQLLNQLRREFLLGNRDTLSLEEWSLKLLMSVIRRSYTASRSRPTRRLATERAHQELAERTRLFLATRYAEDFGLDEMACSLHSSTFHLCRVFRNEVGLSIHQYRNRLRVRAALGRLVEGETDLARLAAELGFASHSHFCDVFRCAFGVSPSECRKRANSGWLREVSKNLEAAASFSD